MGDPLALVPQPTKFTIAVLIPNPGGPLCVCTVVVHEQLDESDHLYSGWWGKGSAVVNRNRDQRIAHNDVLPGSTSDWIIRTSQELK